MHGIISTLWNIQHHIESLLLMQKKQRHITVAEVYM